jgi:hypothetical protein
MAGPRIVESAVNHIGYCPTETRSSNSHDDSFLGLTRLVQRPQIRSAFLGNDAEGMPKKARSAWGLLELLVSSDLLKALSQPNFNYRLPRNAQTPCLPVQGIDHPSREIAIHPALFLKRPPRFGQIQGLGAVTCAVGKLHAGLRW